MNKLKMIFVAVVLFICAITIETDVFAESIEDKLLPIEFTDSFKEYMNLSDEEKSKVLQPRAYEVKKSEMEVTNPIKTIKRLGASIDKRFSLKDVIPNNVVVKNQKRTSICWAFSALSSLETNLGLNVNRSKVYDFSESHMDYSLTRQFAGGELKKNGLKRTPGSVGNFDMAITYLTNGSGAIEEEKMPFSDSGELKSLSEISNKKAVTQVYDTVSFAEPKTAEELNELKEQIKEHIKSYGSVSAGIHGANLENAEYYNNFTGALYCDDASKVKMDHAVSIVGWDDDYDKNNFNEKHRPSNNGAWIIKNSWGEYFDEIDKDELLNSLKAQNPSIDISKITDEELIEFLKTESGMNVEIVDNKVKALVGDKGFMYVSYEDVFVYQMLAGIVKSSDSIDYDNIYQYNMTGFVGYYERTTATKAYLANVFNRENSANEFLKYISISSLGTQTCKVYVNPNNSSKAKKDLVGPINLKSGISVTFDAGYHTLEFENPIEIKGDSFVVVVEIEEKGDEGVSIPVECKTSGSFFDYAEIENDKCFVSFDNFENGNDWTDLSRLCGGDSTIKAFTTFENSDDSLKNIEIKNPPTKTKYFEGENFNKAGMVVQANYNNGTSLEITDYDITNGNNLVEGQTDIIITYEGQTAVQKITVEKNSVVELKIKEPPTKTEYIAGQNFDRAGMIIEATYKDGTKTNITGYTIANENNLKNGQTYVTVSYEGITVNQNITVNENKLVKLEISKPPTKVNYIAGQNFDKAGMKVVATYENELAVEVSDYTIEEGRNLKEDQKYVTIRFEDKSVRQNITVEKKSVESIFITKNPNKLRYIQNKENLVLDGGIIRITYNDGDTSEIPMTDEMITISGFNNEELGNKQITISYYEKTATFEIEIIEEEKPVNCNFEDAKFTCESADLYFEEDNLEAAYVIMYTELVDIKRDLDNDSYEYYYYISKNPQEETINEWTKIKEEQSESDKLIFALDTREIPNYEDVANESEVYLYIKEVVSKGGNQLTKVSQAINFEELSDSAELRVYIDGKLHDIDDLFEKPTPTNPPEKKDDTVYDGGKIPQTGEKTIIMIVIVIVIISIVVYIKYKKISKELK